MSLRSSLSTISLLAAIGAALAATAAVAPASAQVQGADRVRQICRSVIRAEPGQAQYDGCVESLGGSLQGMDQGRALQAAHEACLGQGLRPGTPALAECTLGGTDIQPAALKTSDPVVAQSPLPGGARSWFSISNRDRLGRERLACARLGLDPISGAFDSCVAGLRATMFERDNPSN